MRRHPRALVAARSACLSYAAMGETFRGAKIAIVHGARVLVFLRDDFTHIPFPAHWDFAGGGREGDETPEHCALRELHEEFGLRLTSERIVWRKIYADTEEDEAVSYFMVAFADTRDLADLRLGDEGQCWDWMPVESFLTHPSAVPYLQVRLSDFLRERPGLTTAKSPPAQPYPPPCD